MWFIFQVIKALIIKRRLRVYKREKQISYQKYHRRKVLLAFFDRISHFWDNFIFCGLCKALVKKLLSYFNGIKKFKRFKAVVKTDGTLENYIFTSAAGFFGGVLLVYIFFTFFVLQMNFPYSSSTIVCSLLGFFLTLGLAFSANVRCVVLMVLPQLFSERGRHALLAYAFLLTLSGPTKNLLHNTRVLTESLACSQEQLKAATQHIRELAKAPFYAIKVAIIAIVKAFKVIIKKVKDVLLAIKRIIISIVHVIKSAADWLLGSSSMCNKKFGTPFQRCEDSISEAVSECKVSVPDWASSMCSIAYAGKIVCYPVKLVDYFCDFISFISDDVIGGIKKKIKDFSRHLKTMFYVKITFSHSFSFRTNQTKSMHDIASGIMNEVKSKTHWFTHLFSWMSFTFMFFIVYLVYQVLYYRFRFLSSLSFDNKFLSKHLYDIDFKRGKLGRETILPLNRREASHYIEVTSAKLLAKERRSLWKASWFLLMTTFKLCVHMCLDVALNWLLLLLQKYGRLQVHVDVPNSINMRVKGKGLLADLYRSVANALKPLGLEMHVDTLPCLPNPLPPDYFRYKQIFSLIGLVWALTILQPYAKRMRNIIMSYYHPDIAKERAVWLYNHILRSRSNFLTFARRQLRRKFSLRSKQLYERVTLMQWIYAMCPFLDWLHGQDRGKACLLCGQPETPTEELVKCPTFGCIGIFCQKCYKDLNNTCTICKSPLEYGDLSDISEEKDSSDEDGDEVNLILKKPSQSERKSSNSKKDETQSNSEKDSKIKTGKSDVQSKSREKDVQNESEKSDVANKSVKIDAQKSDDDDVETSATSNTQFSYSYQDKEFTDHTNAPLVIRPTFKDVEAQRANSIVSDVDLQSENKSSADSLNELENNLIPAKNQIIKENKSSNEPEKSLKSKPSPLQASVLNSRSVEVDKSLILDKYFNKMKEYNSSASRKNSIERLNVPKTRERTLSEQEEEEETEIYSVRMAAGGILSNVSTNSSVEANLTCERSSCFKVKGTKSKQEPVQLIILSNFDKDKKDGRYKSVLNHLIHSSTKTSVSSKLKGADGESNYFCGKTVSKEEIKFFELCSVSDIKFDNLGSSMTMRWSNNLRTASNSVSNDFSYQIKNFKGKCKTNKWKRAKIKRIKGLLKKNLISKYPGVCAGYNKMMKTKENNFVQDVQESVNLFSEETERTLALEATVDSVFSQSKTTHKAQFSNHFPRQDQVFDEYSTNFEMKPLVTTKDKKQNNISNSIYRSWVSSASSGSEFNSKQRCGRSSDSDNSTRDRAKKCFMINSCQKKKNHLSEDSFLSRLVIDSQILQNKSETSHVVDSKKSQDRMSRVALDNVLLSNILEPSLMEVKHNESNLLERCEKKYKYHENRVDLASATGSKSQRIESKDTNLGTE